MIRRFLAVPVALAAAVIGLSLATPRAPMAAQEAKPAAPPELELVPAQALGFAHVKVAEVWGSPAMGEVRTLFKKAGAAAFKTIDADFHPAPSTIDRITTVMLPFRDPSRPDISTVTILRFTEPYDAKRVTKQYMPKGEAITVAGKEYTSDKGAGVSIHYADDKTLVFGDADTVPAYLKLMAAKVDRKGEPPFKAALALAATKPLVACIDTSSIDVLAKNKEAIPAEYRPLAEAKRLTLSADFAKDATIELGLQFGNEADAKAGSKALTAAIDLPRQYLAQQRQMADGLLKGQPKAKSTDRSLDELPMALAGLGLLAGINTLDELLADLPIETSGSLVGTKLVLPAKYGPYLASSILAAGVGLPMVQKVRNSAARLQSTNNLKQIGIAMHVYHDTMGSFPPAALCDKKGNKLLSWRVLILPYMEQDNLYKRFALDEGWDSKNNKPFVESAVKTYLDPRFDYGKELNRTHYKLFVGGGSPFGTLESSKIFGITDGTSNTVMVVAAGDPVPWAKPDDFDFDPEKVLPDLSKPFDDLLYATCDGAVHSVRPDDVKDFDKIMKLLIQAADGNVIPHFEPK